MNFCVRSPYEESHMLRYTSFMKVLLSSDSLDIRICYILMAEETVLQGGRDRTYSFN